MQKDVLSSDIKSMIFLNCGAKIDFTDQWFYQENSDIKTFIFDSFRPINHNNVLTTKGVYVVDFGDIKIEECPEDADFPDPNDIDFEEEEGNFDGEKEYEMIINGGKDKVEEDKEDEKSEKDGEGDDDHFDIDAIGKKRKREEEPDTAEDRAKRRRRADEYYEGDYYSNCCAYYTYSLGVQLNKQSVEFFWLWMLGLTDQLVHSKISPTEYSNEYDKCKKDFLLITEQNFNQENDSFKENDRGADISGTDKKFDSKGYFYKNVDLNTDNFKVGSIIPSQEFRFMFMRSWSLYESACNSEYVAIKLRLWEDAGKKELNRFFVTLGIPTHEYNQQYKFMSPNCKETMKNKIQEVAPKFGLNNLLFPSFVRQINNKTQMNASDMVYVVTSLLESPKPVLIENIPDIEEEENKNGDVFDPKNFSLEEYRTQQIENFWAAYSSLNIKNTDYIN